MADILKKMSETQNTL